MFEKVLSNKRYLLVTIEGDMIIPPPKCSFCKEILPIKRYHFVVISPKIYPKAWA